jgi:hypothetical protein
MAERPQKIEETRIMTEETRKPPEQPALKLEHVDLPDLPETFADSINQVFFDGQTLRINFGVTRVDPPGQPQTARRYPACRLVLTPGAAVELMNQIQRLTAGMIQAGVLKAAAAPAHPAAATPPSADKKMN